MQLYIEVSISGNEIIIKDVNDLDYKNIVRITDHECVLKNAQRVYYKEFRVRDTNGYDSFNHKKRYLSLIEALKHANFVIREKALKRDREWEEKRKLRKIGELGSAGSNGNVSVVDQRRCDVISLPIFLNETN